MKAEELYVGGKLARTLYFYDSRIAKGVSILAGLKGFGKIDTKFLMKVGRNDIEGEHGYTEPTFTLYYSGAKGYPAIAERSGVGKRNGMICATGVKYGLSTKTIEYKYLMIANSMESVPMSDMGILSFYALTVVNKNKKYPANKKYSPKLKNQLDVYFTVPRYSDLLLFSEQIGLDIPLMEENLFDPDDLIGITCIRTTMKPVRLKYYKRSPPAIYSPNPDGSCDVEYI